MKSKKEVINPTLCQSEAQQKLHSACLDPSLSPQKSKIDDSINSNSESLPINLERQESSYSPNTYETKAKNFQNGLKQIILKQESIVLSPDVLLLPATTEQMVELITEMVTFSRDLMSYCTELVGKLNLNPDTSSISPSNRNPISKPCPKPWLPSGDDDDGDKKQGGQPGHPRHTRPKIDPNEADQVIPHDIEVDKRFCANCGGALERDESLDKQFDHLELPKLDLIKIVNICYGYRCPHCGKNHHNIPDNVVDTGLISNSVLTLMCDLNINYHQSIRKCADLLKHRFKGSFSIGYINNLLKSAAFAIRPIALEVRDEIKRKDNVNADETLHRFKGNNLYTWVFVADDLVAYRIGTRSYYPLETTLGPNFRGTIGSDCYYCYIKYAKEHEGTVLQLCLAHVTREFNFCANYLDPEVERYGSDILVLLDELFHEYHARLKIHDRNSSEWSIHTAALHALKDKIIKSAIAAPAACNKAVNLGKRFEEYGDYYFTFIDNPDIQPTNNVAELAVRDGCVIDRKIKIGTTSFYGNLFCETMWTIYRTAERLKLNVSEFILQALNAAAEGKPLPSLVNIGGFVDQKFIDEAKREKKKIKSIIAEEKAQALAEAAAKKNGQPSTSKPSRKGGKRTKSSRKSPRDHKTEPPPDSVVSPPDETPKLQPSEASTPKDEEDRSPPDKPPKPQPSEAPTLKNEEDKPPPPINQKELESQKTLLGGLFQSYRANQEAKKNSTRDRKATGRSKPSQGSWATIATPRTLKPTTRRLKAPVPATTDLEPAPMGLSATF